MFPLLLLALLSPALQDGCLKCDHLGVLPCPNHADTPEERPAPENPLLFCSVAAACTGCAGTLWIDCPKCAGGPRSAEVEAQRASVTAWMQQTPLESQVGHTLQRCETHRFELVVDVEVLPDGAKKMKGHTLMHKMALDLEHVAAKVAEHYAIQDVDYRAKMRMWIFTTLQDHQKAMEKFLGTVTGGDFKMLGRDPVFSVWTERGNFDTVPRVRTLFAHNAGHMLLSNAFQSTWVGDVGGGWLDAGLGHWYEYERFGRTTNYCFEEATLADSWEGGQWRAPIRKRLASEPDPFLPALFQKRTGDMNAKEKALCWSFYDFLLAEHRDKLRPLMIALKKNDRREKTASDLFNENVGLTLVAAEAAWREWVAANYPTKGDEPRTTAEKDKDKKKG